jgi:hypothetical protein
MSPALKPFIVPETLTHSVFRNPTDRPLYVWWAGTHGLTIAPGGRFKVPGDPRIPDFFKRGYSPIQSIRDMMERGVLELCSTPAPVIDNNTADGLSNAIYGESGNPYLEEVPLSRDTLSGRTLPAVTPVLSYLASATEITADWSAETGLEIHDRFELQIVTPKGRTVSLKTGSDRLVKYTVRTKDGLGDYKVTVTLLSVDGRTQSGPETVITIADLAVDVP